MRAFCLAVVALVFWASPAPAGEPDYADYAALLEKHVIRGVVDYGGLKKEEDRLDSALKAMSGTEPEALTPDQLKALYINAYNAWTIKLILMNYPGVKSIKNIGGVFSGPWKEKFVRLNGRVISLDTLEHDLLRPKFRDPRIHFAINCASKGCPPLLNRPYRGGNLDATLDMVTADFINDPKRTFVKGDKLYLTKIMDWFRPGFRGRPGGLCAALRPRRTEKAHSKPGRPH